VCATWGGSEEAFEHEKFLILCFKDMGCNLANLTDGGDGPHGYKYTEEQKLKMSLCRTGRKHSEETKRKISIAQIGVPRKKASEETRKKMREAHKGRAPRQVSDETKKKLSENNGVKRPEVREKISKALIGRKPTEEQLKKMSVFQKGRPKSKEHVEKIRLARLAYFEEQRKLHGKSKSISEEHKSALRAGYNKHFGLTNETDK
jgi:hypothetical protein